MLLLSLCCVLVCSVLCLSLCVCAVLLCVCYTSVASARSTQATSSCLAVMVHSTTVPLSTMLIKQGIVLLMVLSVIAVLGVLSSSVQIVFMVCPPCVCVCVSYCLQYSTCRSLCQPPTHVFLCTFFCTLYRYLCVFVGRTSVLLLPAVAQHFFVSLYAHANMARCDHQRANERVFFCVFVVVCVAIGGGCVSVSRVALGRCTDYP